MSIRSKRFLPSAFIDKFIPIVLIILVLILIGSLVIIGLSLMGVTPST